VVVEREAANEEFRPDEKTYDFAAIKFGKFHRPDQTLKRAVESSQYLRAAASLSSVLAGEV
jgi:hypothetical protein